MSILFRDMMWEDMVDTLLEQGSPEALRARFVSDACDYVEFALGDVGVINTTVHYARQPNENTEAV